MIKVLLYGSYSVNLGIVNKVLLYGSFTGT
jgi:hypothetical protein